MSSLLSYVWPRTENKSQDDLSISVAESVTAGALSNTLCSEPGASKFFKGGIVAYSIKSKKEILGIDIKYAEKNNFANPFTTSEMARSVVKIFKSRFGIATTGYSLPITRPENKELDECALDIKKPYAYICLYDSLLDTEIITKEEFEYNNNDNSAIQKASVQARVALKAKHMYDDYISRLKNENK